MSEIIISTTDEIPGKKIKKVLGVVQGNTVRVKNFGVDIIASLKNFIGGEVKSYTDMSILAREEAFNRMINEAVKLKADAIVGMKFSTSVVMQGASEMLAYGTAVKLK